MSILNYLPTSESSAKVAEALKPYENDLYVVGSAARKHLYGLKTEVTNYDFVCTYVEESYSVDGDLNIMVGEDPAKQTFVNGVLKKEFADFALTIRFCGIDEFLFKVRFAGDGLAVKVSDGRPLVLPEYMTLPPMVAIIKTEETDAQNQKEWVDNHLVVLAKFQEELYNLVNKKLDEPAKN